MRIIHCTIQILLDAFSLISNPRRRRSISYFHRRLRGPSLKGYKQNRTILFSLSFSVIKGASKVCVFVCVCMSCVNGFLYIIQKKKDMIKKCGNKNIDERMKATFQSPLAVFYDQTKGNKKKHNL